MTARAEGLELPWARSEVAMSSHPAGDHMAIQPSVQRARTTSSPARAARRREGTMRRPLASIECLYSPTNVGCTLFSPGCCSPERVGVGTVTGVSSPSLHFAPLGGIVDPRHPQV